MGSFSDESKSIGEVVADGFLDDELGNKATRLVTVSSASAVLN